MKKEEIIRKIETGKMDYSQVSVFKKNDIDIVKAYIRVAKREELAFLAKKYKNNLELFTCIISREPRLYFDAGKKLRTDYDLAHKAITLYPANYAYMDDSLQYDPDLAILSVEGNPRCISLIKSDLLKDSHVALSLLKINLDSWTYLNHSLKCNKSFLTKVAKELPHAIEFYDSEYTNDFEIVSAAVNADGRTILYASDELKDNEELALSAIKQYGSTLKHLSNRIKNDKLLVLAAVANNGLALEYANASLQDDEEVVLEAIRENPKAIAFASKRLLHDEKFLRKCEETHVLAFAAIKEARALEARSYKLKSIRSDDVQVRNGVLFGARIKDNSNELYNSIMQKSFTQFLDKLSVEELLVLDRLVKADANMVVEEIKKFGKDDLTDRDIRTIATYRKIYLRIKQMKLDENNYDRSKVDMPKCYKLVDEAYKIADRVVNVVTKGKAAY